MLHLPGVLTPAQTSELRQRAQRRVDQLKAKGESRAQLYGADPEGPLGGLNAFFLLVDEPEALRLGASWFVCKPTDGRRLRSEIQQLAGHWARVTT